MKNLDMGYVSLMYDLCECSIIMDNQGGGGDLDDNSSHT